MRKSYLILILCVLTIQCAYAQVYTEKQTRHRFAQLNLGLDYQMSVGGETSYINQNGALQTLSLESLGRPRFLIGGTHFWGHADIYIAIPLLGSSLNKENQRLSYFSGVETVFKYYPWRITHNRLRPFIGFSLAPFYYEQRNNNVEFGNGPELNHTALPLYSGFTFNRNNHLLELGLMWNYNNSQAYYISETTTADVQTPPFYAAVSYRYMIETTLSAEKGWESGRTELITQKLAEQKRLNSFYLGVGMSSAFWIQDGSYNTALRPYIERYSTSIMPEFSLGYYLHKPDLNLALAYRGYGSSTSAYGAIQQVRRRSLVLEATKFLFDYHGFVPFVGPAVSYEDLTFKESFEGQLTQDKRNNQIGYGLAFGWDIRPDRIQSFILRTSLRWFPNLNLEVENDQFISFNNIEFNFIQFILYPQRMFGRSKK